MPPQLIKCIFCHSMMTIPQMPPINYIEHLEKHHQIIFEMDFVINRTLLEQHPHLVKETITPQVSEGGDEDSIIDPVKFLKQSNGSIEHEFVIDPDTGGVKIKEENFDVEEDTVDNGNFPEDIVFADDEDIEMDDLNESLLAENNSKADDNLNLEENSNVSENIDLGKNSEDNMEIMFDDEVDSKENIVLLDKNMDISDFGNHFLNDKTSYEPKLPWYHGCLYSCQLCMKQFINKEAFKQHIETAHTLVFEKYEKTENGEKSYIKNTHECEQCGKGVTWNKSAIEGHLTGQHNITLDEYYKEYKDDIELPSFDITDPTLLSRFGSEGSDKKADDTLSMSSTGYDFSWANKCIYKCNICENTQNSRYEFERHMPSKHNISVTDYTRDHGKGIIHQEKHFCQIENCNSKVYWDRTSIVGHLRKHDNMSIQDYEAKYMENYKGDLEDSMNNKSVSVSSFDLPWANRCIYNCVICDTKVSSRKGFESHIKGKHKLTLSDYTADHGRTVDHEEKHICQVEGCGSTFLWDSIAINSHLRKKHDIMSLEVYGKKYMENYNDKLSKSIASSQQPDQLNRCIYKCALCEVEFFSKFKLIYHLKNAHSISMNDYSKKYGRNMSHEEKHSCQVESCDAFIWWDRSTIGNHIRNVHYGMNLDEYEAKYMTSYAEKTQSKKEDVSSVISSADYSWANRCTFKCGLCDVTMDSRRKFEGHVKGKHMMMMGEYAEKYGRTVEHEEKHTCQIKDCSSTFLWDSIAIVGHMKLKHDSLPLHEYEIKYMSTYAEKSSNTKAKPETGDVSWANRCKFKCSICETTVDSRKTFESHIKTNHDMFVGDYTIQYGKCIEYEERHYCQVEDCDSTLQWDLLRIKSHLKLKHEEINLDDYKNKYMATYSEKLVEKGKIKKEKSASQDNFPWANKCIFKCALCENEFGNRGRFTYHIKNVHNISVKDYLKEHGKSITHEESHSCQVELCHAFVMWDKMAIYDHLYDKHDKMTLDEYETKFMGNYVEKVRIKTEKPQKTTPSFPFQDFSWANKCKFRCAICDITADSRRKFEGHIKGKHEMLMGDYATKYGKAMEHEEKHACQVESCTSTFLWDSIPIVAHLRLKHNSLSLQEYEKKYMDNYMDKSEKVKNSNTTTTLPGYNVSWANRCVFKCIICDITKKSRKKFEKHIKLMHQLNLTEYQKEHGKTMAVDTRHKCQIEKCDSSFTWDVTSFVRHFRLLHEKMTLQEYEQTYMVSYQENEEDDEENKQNDELDQCTFVCHICEVSYNSENNLITHLKKDHTIGTESYKKDFGLEADRKVFHTCQICEENTSLLWDSNALFVHVKEVHQTPPEQYLQDHVKSLTLSSTENIPEEEQWMFKCQFACKQCKLSFNKKELLQKHLIDIHGYQGIPDDSELNFLRKEFHKCLICKTKTEIVCDKINIENHLRTNHVIGLTTYHKYPAPVKQDDEWMNKCQFECIVEGCGILFNTSNLLGVHFVENHKDDKFDNSKSPMHKTVRHECQICQEELMWESAYLRPHIEKHDLEPREYKEKYMFSYQFNERFVVPVQVKANAEKSVKMEKIAEESEEVLTWTAGTLYLCNICNKEVAGLYQFEKHLKTLHQTDYKQYERNHTDFVKFPGFHICKVCQKNVKHDRKPLKNHMKEHNISITEYFHKYNPKMPKLYKHMKNKK